MLLTRLGPNAKCIITGDLSQVDLPHHQRSGLKHGVYLLGGVDGIGVVYLDENDVVRHRLVKEIIRAYRKDDERKQALRQERETAEKQRFDDITDAMGG
jgi:phosphate starvation-inducible PhoH-like protein